MKKLVSIILTLAAVFVFSITAFAAGSPYFELPEAKLFSVSSKDGVSPEEIYNYGLEKGFNGVLLDLRESASMDFYSDPFEINNQVLFNKLNGFGFCVSDYSELVKNIGGKADFLTAYFDSKILEEHANFSYPKKLSITRPAGSKISVATDKYTVFGTSDPENRFI